MLKNTIRSDEYQKWAIDTEIEYAAETIQKGSAVILYRLRFLVKVLGGYKVTLKNKVLYEGNCFSDAADAYHSAAE